VINSLGIDASEAVFLDDHQPNIEAAESVGIRSFLVKGDIQDSINWVDQAIS
jgi:FMN phosphatase YigB (HAD superfamily)